MINSLEVKQQAFALFLFRLEFAFVGQGLIAFEHVAYAVIAAGPTLNLRLFETVWWNNFAGHTVYRRFDLMNADDDPVSGGAQEIPNTWLVRSGLTWRIPMD